MVGFGIDFGTTNSVAAAFNGREVTPFVDDNNLPHPSVVWYKFVKDVMEPLVALDLIETEKTTGWRGAKPNSVKLTDKARAELVSRLLSNIADLGNKVA